MNKPSLVSRLNRQANSLDDIRNLAFEYIMGKPEDKRRESFEWFLSEITIMDLDTSGWDNLAIRLSEDYSTGKNASVLAKQMVSSMVEKCVNRKIFFDELWSKMTDDILLPTNEDKKTFLLSLWLDNRIPYFDLDSGVEMSEDEYNNRRSNISDVIAKAMFISSIEFDQKTKKASLLADEAAKIGDRRSLAVFWAVVINSLEAHAQANAVKKLITQEKSL